MSLAQPAPTPSRWLRAALPAMFILLGVIYATWASRLPAIRDLRVLDAATLGTILLGGGLGAVLSFPLAAWLLAHYGARRAALYAGLGLLFGLPLLGVLPNWWLLFAGVFVLGAASSCFDVAINAIGAEQEREAGRSIMSMLHAWFCVGTFSGALVGSAAAGLGLSPLWHFLLVAFVLLLMLICAYRILPCDAPDPDAGKKHFALPHGALIWLGLIAFLGAISEGSLTDWISLYLTDHLHASEAGAPLGYAAFAGAMLVARLVGDRLKDRFGARRLVAGSSLLAAVGLGVAIAAPSFGVAVIGFVLTGLGVAAVFPCLFSAAGREGPTALAGVATLGYSGSLMGPPLMGYAIHGYGYVFGMALLAVVSVFVAVAAMRARLLV
ncbi:MFS transporter [Chitinimonas sp. BJYL2]|uniref:MFS transporter n=1 Tax=Chitinimonas sp. BJYL2 TaxID=2976696 RepID=UPI0022B546F0|nr:MFS transporter [Chitinimonas sp. BJYL2]